MIAKHKYAETVGISLSGAALSTYRWNLNSTYDPNRSGTGHQPYGRDTYASLYNRYRVIGCSYNLSIVPNSSGLATQICVIPANEELANSTMSECREQPRSKFIVQAGAGNGAPIKMLSGYVDIASLMGLTNTQYRANENTQAQNGASPTELAILNMVVGTFTEDVITTAIYVNCTLTYFVEWFDPIILSQS